MKYKDCTTPEDKILEEKCKQESVNVQLKKEGRQGINNVCKD